VQKNKIWVTKAIRVSIRHKTRLYKKYLTRPSMANKLVYTNYKNKLVNLLKISRKDYYTNLLITENGSQQQIWKVYAELVGRKNKKKSQDIKNLLIDGKKITGDTNIANAFNTYFANIGSELANSFPKNNAFSKYLNEQHANTMFLSPVTEAELAIEISKLSWKKSAGLDNISPRLVKLSMQSITNPLTHIYNLSFTEGCFPDKLKIAKVIPIYKKKEVFSPNNYRPISLLSIFDKLLEKLMYKRLYSFFTKYDLLYDYQFGFREKHSTVMAVIEIVDNIREELDKGNSVIGVYLDLSKAFDTVNHQILLNKLDYYGIRGQSLKWLSSYLVNRQQVTFVNSTYSCPLTVNTGVPQGSVLGPLLFLIYMNDISKTVTNSKLRLFADDSNLFVSGSSVEQIVNDSNIMLTRLFEWFQANELTLNVDKTCFTLFTNKKNVRLKEKLIIDGKVIHRVSSTKYLGLFLDENLSWTSHIDYVAKKLVKLKGALHYISDFIDKEYLRQIYFAYVFPHIKYGIELYGTCSAKLMKRIQTEQNKILKILYKKDFRYNTNKLHGELSLLKCQDIHNFFISIFVYKQQSSTLPKVFKNYFIVTEDLGRRQTRQSKELFIKRYRTKGGEKCIKCIGAKLWNDIDNEIKKVSTLSMFKVNYKKYLLSKYV